MEGGGREREREYDDDERGIEHKKGGRKMKRSKQGRAGKGFHSKGGEGSRVAIHNVTTHRRISAEERGLLVVRHRRGRCDRFDGAMAEESQCESDCATAMSNNRKNTNRRNGDLIDERLGK